MYLKAIHFIDLKREHSLYLKTTHFSHLRKQIFRI